MRQTSARLHDHDQPMPRIAALVAVVWLVGGCYRAHERAGDGGAARDADRDGAADAAVTCGVSDIQVEADLRHPGLHSVPYMGALVADDGVRELAAAYGLRGRVLEICVPRASTPFTANFGIEGNHVVVLGMDGDFDGQVWGGIDDWDPAPPDPELVGELVHAEPGSRLGAVLIVTHAFGASSRASA